MALRRCGGLLGPSRAASWEWEHCPSPRVRTSENPANVPAPCTGIWLMAAVSHMGRSTSQKSAGDLPRQRPRPATRQDGVAAASHPGSFQRVRVTVSGGAGFAVLVGPRWGRGGTGWAGTPRPARLWTETLRCCDLQPAAPAPVCVCKEAQCRERGRKPGVEVDTDVVLGS